MEKVALRLKKLFAWLLPVLGIALFYLAFRNIKFEELKAEIFTVKPEWLLFLLVPSWGGQFLRSWRWKLLLDSKSSEIKYMSVYHALVFGYFVNLGLPRVGEISRCIALSRIEKIEFGRSLGTVVLERLVDLAFLVLVVVLALWMQWNSLREFYLDNILNPLNSLFVSNWTFVLAVGICALIGLLTVLFYRKTLLQFLNKSTKGFSDKLSEGLLSFTRLSLSQVILFFALSIGIWIGYFLTTWFWFLALPSASGSNIAVAFSVMVVGSLAKTLPIQGGGVGAYHILIGQLLILYGLGEVSSQTFALLNHGYQTVFYLLFGGASALWLFLRKRKLNV